MDPQSQSFYPSTGSSNNSNTNTSNDSWRLQNDVARIQQIQAEHSDRIARLEAVPDLRRETFFLGHDGPMAKADRTAREIKALRPDAAEAARHNVDPEALMKRLADHSRTTEKIRTTLETIHETRGNDVPRARVAALRSGGVPKSATGKP